MDLGHGDRAVHMVLGGLVRDGARAQRTNTREKQNRNTSLFCFYTEHRQHLGTQDNSIQMTTTPTSFTPGKIHYDKPLHVVVEPPRQGYIHKARFAS